MSGVLTRRCGDCDHLHGRITRRCLTPNCSCNPSGAVAWVDFNDVDAAGAVTTLAKFATSPLRVGQHVTARDDDGNSRPGVIKSIDAMGVVMIRLD